MLRRFRRRSAAALAAVLLLSPLAACGAGSDNDSDAEAGASATAELSAVTFTGEVGKSLKATWHSKVDTPKSNTVTTLVKGTGAKIADGDTVSAYLYLGNGTTKQDAYSDYTNGSPESIPNNKQLSGVLTKLFSDATYGSGSSP